MGQPQLCPQGVPVPVGRQTPKPINVVVRVRISAAGREDAPVGWSQRFAGERVGQRARERGLLRLSLERWAHSLGFFGGERARVWTHVAAGSADKRQWAMALNVLALARIGCGWT